MKRAAEHPTPVPETHHIRVHLEELLEERGMSARTLAEKVGITEQNLSILKNGHARMLRLTTLDRLCQALECQPGDILSYTPCVPPSTEEQPAGRS